MLRIPQHQRQNLIQPRKGVQYAAPVVYDPLQSLKGIASTFAQGMLDQAKADDENAINSAVSNYNKALNEFKTKNLSPKADASQALERQNEFYAKNSNVYAQGLNPIQRASYNRLVNQIDFQSQSGAVKHELSAANDAYNIDQSVASNQAYNEAFIDMNQYLSDQKANNNLDPKGFIDKVSQWELLIQDNPNLSEEAKVATLIKLIGYSQKVTQVLYDEEAKQEFNKKIHAIDDISNTLLDAYLKQKDVGLSDDLYELLIANASDKNLLVNGTDTLTKEQVYPLIENMVSNLSAGDDLEKIVSLRSKPEYKLLTQDQKDKLETIITKSNVGYNYSVKQYNNEFSSIQNVDERNASIKASQYPDEIKSTMLDQSNLQQTQRQVEAKRVRQKTGSEIANQMYSGSFNNELPFGVDQRTKTEISVMNKRYSDTQSYFLDTSDLGVKTNLYNLSTNNPTMFSEVVLSQYMSKLSYEDFVILNERQQNIMSGNGSADSLEMKDAKVAFDTLWNAYFGNKTDNVGMTNTRNITKAAFTQSYYQKSDGKNTPLGYKEYADLFNGVITQTVPTHAFEEYDLISKNDPVDINNTSKKYDLIGFESYQINEDLMDALKVLDPERHEALSKIDTNFFIKQYNKLTDEEKQNANIDGTPLDTPHLYNLDLWKQYFDNKFIIKQ